jgi:hypothetical protein
MRLHGSPCCNFVQLNTAWDWSQTFPVFVVLFFNVSVTELVQACQHGKLVSTVMSTSLRGLI